MSAPVPALPDRRTTFFNICKVENNPHAAIFDGVIAQLRGALGDLGYACSLTVNEAASGAVNILVGPAVYAWPVRGHLMPSMLGRQFVLYQFEQLHPRHPVFAKLASTFAEIFDHAGAIWEFAPRNMAYFETSRWRDKVSYLPPAFHRALETFRPRPDPQTDVLFYGTAAPRRLQVLDALSRRGVKVAQLRGAYGAQLDAEVANAKIVLNLHAFPDIDMLETVRVSQLLANRCFVVSETADHNPYGSGIVYAAYDDLVDTCVAYLGPKAAEREAVAAEGYVAVRREDMVANLRAVIARLPLAALTSDP